MICRSREPLLKCANDDDGRLCRVIGEIPEERRRDPGIAEFKVELLAFPLTAFRLARDLEVIDLGPRPSGVLPQEMSAS